MVHGAVWTTFGNIRKANLPLLFRNAWKWSKAWSKISDKLVFLGKVCIIYLSKRLLSTPNPRSLLENIVTRSLEGGGGQSDPPPPSTFNTIHPINLKFGKYSKLHLNFQLSENTWCVIGFHGNNGQINDVTGGRHFGFSNFQILFKFSLWYLKLTGK